VNELNRGLRLVIATPATLLVDVPDVASFRAEDASGGFGVLPGHADFVTTLPACVLRWRTEAQVERFCAVRGGVLTVKDGAEIRIACRYGVLGDDVETLEAEVRIAAAARADLASRVRVEQTRLHAYAVRQLVRYLRPAGLAPRGMGDREGDAS
jgi:F-type H+-transporting ATPase subunit epsilon